ncbi:MAG: hypothetical protein LBM16_04255 [Clostridiales bacterium]|nr:hypothetical protein [Clostridiales bacterium]
MGREGKRRILKDIVRNMSREYESKKPDIDSAVFIPACESAESGQVISNLAFVLAERELNVCVADFNVFYPSMFAWIGADTPPRGEGLIKLLKNDRTPLKDVLQTTREKQIFLLSASQSDDLEDYYNFDFSHVCNVIKILKNNFDVTLINTPNIPSLEFCLASMKFCTQGFFIAEQRIEVLSNISKLLNHAMSIGISSAKFLEIIFINFQNASYDVRSFKDNKFNVTAIPFVPNAIISQLENEIYLRDQTILNKEFLKGIHKIADKFYR